MQKKRLLQQQHAQKLKDRMDKFLRVIKNYQRDQVTTIQQKSKDEREFETHKIEAENRERNQIQYTKKFKGVEVEVKIQKSRKINQMKMSKMKLRFQMIQKIISQTKDTLLKKVNQKDKYMELLRKLIIQSMIKMLEEAIEIKCLKRDLEIVKQLAIKCQQEFDGICDVKSVLSVNERQFLPSSDLGGIVLTSLSGRIVCDNTFRARLDHAAQLTLPEIRSILFEGK